MVAMAILAMSLVALFDVVGTALRAHERTHALGLATLLARAKLAEVEAQYQQDGFKDFDETSDGRFDEEGHPEIAWAVVTLKPSVELGPDGVVKALTGVDGGLDGLLAALTGAAPGQAASGQASGPTTSAAASPLAGLAKGLMSQQLTALGEKLKRGVRQVRLTVSWPAGQRTESFTVVTHLVILAPGAAGPLAPGVPVAPGLPGQPGLPAGLLPGQPKPGGT
jgi:general secretion pathway protein I